MDRKCIKRTCCVCLTNGLSYNKLSKKDEKNISLQEKLNICVKEVEWISSYHICIQCTNLLGIVLTFRETCLNSDLIRRKEQGSIKDEENGWQEETLSDTILEKGRKDDFTPDVRKDSIKVEQSSDVFITVEDVEVTTDPLYSSESEQENEKSQSDVEEEYKHKKRKKPRKQKKNQDKKDKPIKKREVKTEFKCEKCPHIFPNRTKLIEHCVSQHQMESKDVKPYECDRCPQKFSTPANLKQHIKYHDGIKIHMCSYCGKGCFTKRDLTIHEKRHLRLGEYKCEPCGKSFHAQRDLSIHQLVVHTDSSKWKYVCKVCNKPFPMKSNFDTHVARHAGEKNFACHLCEKKFTRNYDLQKHIKSHSHVREHQCQLCEKEYKEKKVLKVHMAKIHGIGVGEVKIPVRERKFRCHICPKAFYDKSKLTRHIYTHSGQKPFSCPICKKNFIDKSYVKQHLRSIHNVEQQDNLETELKISCMNSSAGT